MVVVDDVGEWVGGFLNGFVVVFCESEYFGVFL